MKTLNIGKVPLQPRILYSNDQGKTTEISGPGSTCLNVPAEPCPPFNFRGGSTNNCSHYQKRIRECKHATGSDAQPLHLARCLLTSWEQGRTRSGRELLREEVCVLPFSHGLTLLVVLAVLEVSSRRWRRGAVLRVRFESVQERRQLMPVSRFADAPLLAVSLCSITRTKLADDQDHGTTSDVVRSGWIR